VIAFVQDEVAGSRYNPVMNADRIVLPPGGARAYECTFADRAER
jgi:hypothetical protein